MGNFIAPIIKSLKERHFSKRITLVYSCVIILPLTFSMLVVSVLISRQSYKNAEEICEKNLKDNLLKVQENIKSIELVEKMINANGEFLLFLTSPEDYTQDEVIEMTIQEETTLERILSIEPHLNGVRVFADNKNVPERFPSLLSSGRTNLEDQEKWDFSYKVDYLNYLNPGVSDSVCKTTILYNGRRKIGYVQVSVDVENFFPFIYRADDKYQDSFVFKYDSSKKVKNAIGTEQCSFNPLHDRKFVLNFENDFFDKNTIKVDNQMKTLKLRADNKKYLIKAAAIPDLKIILVQAYCLSAASLGIGALWTVSTLIILISCCLFFILISYITSRLMTGVYTIVDGMKEIKNGNFNVEIELNAKVDEIRESQFAFNTMTETLRKQVAQIKKEQQLIADTEMKAMQNQINAHFLYNVLETIHMQAVLKEDDDTAESILVLGKMLRYCLRWRIHTVTLSQEIEYINSYIYILNIRNDYKITLKAEIPQKLLNKEIPKMLVQPFVENSFYHGIEPLAEDAEIRLFTEIDEVHNKLWLCVQDFGVGISQEKLMEIRAYLRDVDYERDSEGSIGIKNIQQRLFMFYGKDFELDITSEPGEGTLIKVPVPYK